MRALKIIAVLGFLGLFGLVSVQLFFPESFSLSAPFSGPSTQGNFFQKTSDVPADPASSNSRPLLTVGFGTDIGQLEPTSLDPLVRFRTNQMYEPLVRFDDRLRVTPVLAKSWGRISDTEFEFQIRNNVRFHSGKPLTADDVVASFSRAKNFVSSDLKSFFQDVQMTAFGDDRVRVMTARPDSLLLSKMTFVLIFPAEFAENESFAPNGTGPYRFVSSKKNEESMLKRFDDYWRAAPVFDRIVLQIIPETKKRLEAFLSGEIDFLPFINPSQAQELERRNVKIISVPSFETHFLVFNTTARFQNPRFRQAVIRTLDPDVLLTFIKGYGKKASQFVSRGVFGFSSTLVRESYDLDSARSIVQRLFNFQRLPISIALPVGFQDMGSYIQQQLDAAGFAPTVSYFNPEEIASKAKEFDLFFSGWNFNLGDSFDFFEQAATTNAPENYSSYSNAELDSLVQKGRVTAAAEDRLAILQRISQILLKEDLYGVPLFEPNLLFGNAPDFHFTSSSDGTVLLSHAY